MILAAAQSASIPGDIPRNVERHLRFARAAAAHGAQLLVFPELSLTSYAPSIARAHAIDPASPILDPLRQFAIDACMTIVAGAPVPNERGDLHIAAIIFDPAGITRLYAKEHVHESEAHVFTSGPGGPLLYIGETPVALAICADASHPTHAAAAASRGAAVYAAGVMVTRDAHVRKTALLETYAREHRMAVLMANYSGATEEGESAGRSAIWSEDARIVAEADDTAESLVVARKHDGVWTGFVAAVP